MTVSFMHLCKMCVIAKITILLLVLIQNVILQEVAETQFFVVSTTEGPQSLPKTDSLNVKIKFDKFLVDEIENKIQIHLKKSKQQILDEVSELLENVTRSQNIQSEINSKLVQNCTSNNINLLAKVSELEKANLLLENVTGIQNAQLETYATLLHNHTEQINELVELKKANLLLEKITRIQNIQLESHAKLLKKQSEQIEQLQIKMTNLSDELLPKNCQEIKKNDNLSGVYRIKPKAAPKSFEVWCDMDTKDGGWIYMINRFDGSQNFDLKWTDYKNGFGDISGEHWLGLEHLYELTGAKPAELLIELTDWDSKTAYAQYKTFSIGNEEEAYKINNIKGFTGDGGDAFGFHEGWPFSTPDNNHDTFIKDRNPAAGYGAGWWYKNTYHCLFTAKYIDLPEATNTSIFKTGIECNSFRGYNYSLKKVKMMIRPT